MKIITYLNAMERARYRSKTNEENYLRHKHLNRQYWKFRERLLQRIERLEQFQKDYAGLVLAHSAGNLNFKGRVSITASLDKEVNLYSLPEEIKE